MTLYKVTHVLSFYIVKFQASIIVLITSMNASWPYSSPDENKSEENENENEKHHSENILDKPSLEPSQNIRERPNDNDNVDALDLLSVLKT